MTFFLALAIVGSVLSDISVKTPEGESMKLSEAVKERPAILMAISDSSFKVPAGVTVVISPEVEKHLQGKKAALVDVGRFVRRVAADATKLNVSDWLRGRDIYAAQCARCHGPDGQDTQFSGIKPLNGIGARITEAEIIERTIRSGSVDLTPFDEDARRALAIWVAGL